MCELSERSYSHVDDKAIVSDISGDDVANGSVNGRFRRLAHAEQIEISCGPIRVRRYVPRTAWPRSRMNWSRCFDLESWYRNRSEAWLTSVSVKSFRRSLLTLRSLARTDAATLTGVFRVIPSCPSRGA
jgi:hypothetical protein